MVFAALLFLTACQAAKGPAYSEQQPAVFRALSVGPELVVYKRDHGPVFSRPATVKVDGQKRGVLRNGGYLLLPVSQGWHTLSVGYILESSYSYLNVEAVQTGPGYVEVLPNTNRGNAGSFVKIPSALPKGVLTYRRGNFVLASKPSDQALPALKGLSQSGEQDDIPKIDPRILDF